MLDDEELRELASEVHDELGSLLTAARLQLATLKLHVADPRFDREFGTMAQTLKECMTFAGRFAEELRPPSVAKNFRLTKAIEALAAKFFTADGMKIVVRLDETAYLDEYQKQAVYRVVQETMTNAVKYSQAKHLTIVLKDLEAHAILSVRDDGLGFDKSAPAQGTGHGLRGMEHRVRSLGGNFIVNSKLGEGTLVVAVFPYKENQ